MIEILIKEWFVFLFKVWVFMLKKFNIKTPVCQPRGYLSASSSYFRIFCSLYILLASYAVVMPIFNACHHNTITPRTVHYYDPEALGSSPSLQIVFVTDCRSLNSGVIWSKITFFSSFGCSCLSFHFMLFTHYVNIILARVEKVSGRLCLTELPLQSTYVRDLWKVKLKKHTSVIITDSAKENREKIWGF